MTGQSLSPPAPTSPDDGTYPSSPPAEDGVITQTYTVTAEDAVTIPSTVIPSDGVNDLWVTAALHGRPHEFGQDGVNYLWVKAALRHRVPGYTGIVWIWPHPC